MGADRGDGGPASAMLQSKGPFPGNSSTSNGNNKSSGGPPDLCRSISEYLLQLQAAAPSLRPVPCGSSFTAQTTLKDLTDCTASIASSSSMARDLFASVAQQRADGHVKAFKAFARMFYEVAAQRLAAAKTCSVCAVVREQEQAAQQEAFDDWGLCLLPRLDPLQQTKTFPLPQVVCGRCLGVLRLSEILSAAAANVSAAAAPQAQGGRNPASLAAALEHFISVNSQGGRASGFSPQKSHDGSTSSREGQAQAAARSSSSAFRSLPSEAQRRALDVSLAAAFSIHILSKEVSWELKGPAASLEQLLELLSATQPPTDAPKGLALPPVKAEQEEEPSQEARKKIEEQQEQKQPQQRRRDVAKKKRSSKHAESNEKASATNTAKPQATGGPPKRRKAPAALLHPPQEHQRQQQQKQKQQRQGSSAKNGRLS